jgi:DNA-binding protein H-NS
VRVKKVNRLLQNTRQELAAAKELLKEDLARAKRAKSSKRKLARDNAKRATKLVKKTMESIEDHQNLLLQEKGRR